MEIKNLYDNPFIYNNKGLHISRQMRMGRGVLINKFGLFTFGPVEFNKDVNMFDEYLKLFQFYPIKIIIIIIKMKKFNKY